MAKLSYEDRELLENLINRRLKNMNQVIFDKNPELLYIKVPIVSKYN